FHHSATTYFYTLSLHDALPIYFDIEDIRSTIMSSKLRPASEFPARGSRTNILTDAPPRIFFPTNFSNIPPTREPRCITTHLPLTDRKSTRLNSSHVKISYAVFC